MPINTKTEYAVRALLEMVDNDASISAREICERQHLPKKYVEHLLSGLKSAGLVISSSGSHGGYLLNLEPENINMHMIMQAVGDLSYDPTCQGGRDEFCLGKACGLNTSLDHMAHDIRNVLERYNLRDLTEAYKKCLEKEKS